MWTAAEQVELCSAFKLVAQRADNGADWSKDDLWDSMKADFDGSTPKSLQQGDLKGRLTEHTAVPMQTHFVRKIVPDLQRCAHFFKFFSDKKQLNGRLTEEDLVSAAAGLFSGVSGYQAVR